MEIIIKKIIWILGIAFVGVEYCYGDYSDYYAFKNKEGAYIAEGEPF